MENEQWDVALEEEVAKKIREKGYLYLSEVYDALNIRHVNILAEESASE